MPAKKRPIKLSPEDRDLFRRVAGSARPLEQDRIARRAPRRAPLPDQTRKDEQEVMDSLLSDDYDPAEIETGDELAFVRSGVSQRVWRKLRRGQYAIQAQLDLHGRVVAEARELVADFLRDARTKGRRCVRIIHGKGLSSEGKLPVLKGKVNSWLRQKDEVLAFCSAPRRDGGTGAVYVLLRRS
ncbi:MAG: Smr/MutS family protein [Acidiferrobacterales bacterium]